MSTREKPRLGRGLASLWGEAAHEAVAGDTNGVRQVSIELLESNPSQPRARIDADALEELAGSIRVQGVLQPLLVRPHPTSPDRFQIVAGERRWRAAQQAGLHEVPALIRQLTDAEAAAAALVENLQRQDLNAIEEAEGYRRLLQEFALTQEGVAQTVGKSRSHVANMLRLLNLPQSVQGEVRRGALSAGHARALLALPDPQGAALAVITRGLSVRQTEALSAPPRSRSVADRAEVDDATRAVERELTDQLGLTVQICPDNKGGVVRVRYQNLDQLDGIIALLRNG